MSKNYFIFDQNKCVGCEACVVSCVLENGFQFPERWRTIFSSNENSTPGIPVLNLSLACNHCDDAPCMNYCPSLAYSRDLTTGAVLINSNQCMGCGYCTWNCPYEAPKLLPGTGIIEKCNFCNERLLEDKAPACAISCPTGALDFSFGELDNNMDNMPIAVPVNPYPSLKIIHRDKPTALEMDLSLFDSVEPIKVRKKRPSISSINELPLVIFTFIVSLMIPISASGILQELSILYTVGFVAVGGVAALISALHLGNSRLFWRSILNFKNSSLSREIVFFAIYYGLSFIDLFIFRIPTVIIVFFGLATLVSMDMIYKPLQWNWKINWHAGQTLLISISFYLLLNQMFLVLFILLFIRLALTIFMYSKSRLEVMPIIWILFMVKTGLLIYNHYDVWLIILVYVIGELAARIVFYNDLSIHKIDLDKAR